MAGEPSAIEDLKRYISPIEEVIEEAREGRLFILVDAEDRENEGDLIIPAQFATPEKVNFMARFGRGLICLALTGERTRALGLEPMSRNNGTQLGTAFTVSIEAKEGITTGISAHDRAHTIAVAIDPSKGAGDIVSPGHVFPLAARDGGTLVRAGHTEASVDIARLAGLLPAAVICEIMNDDGTMARLPELVSFAQFHNLKIGTIADLIAYRRLHDHMIDKIVDREFATRYGEGFRVCLFHNALDGGDYAALVKGEIKPDKPTL
ncbi:MAG: 3,4-dihydroxy-2-butanone-4-phosphate synthase, partial [Hyphomonadaceae bacterium]